MSKKTDLEMFNRWLPDLNRLGCVSYLSGHKVHWIQALNSANGKSPHVVGSKAVPATPWPGKVIDVDGEVVTVRRADGSTARFRCHDPVRLIFILEHHGVEVIVDARWSLLRAGVTAGHSFCVSVQADHGKPLEPCVIPGTSSPVQVP